MDELHAATQASSSPLCRFRLNTFTYRRDSIAKTLQPSKIKKTHDKFKVSTWIDFPWSHEYHSVMRWQNRLFNTGLRFAFFVCKMSR